MSIFKKLFGKKSIELSNFIDNNESEQAVIIYFDYKKDNLEPLHSLEKQLEKIINDTMVGEYDGHEIRTDYNDGILYMYGPNAEVLYKTIKPILEATDFMIGATANIRFGPPSAGVKEIEVRIGED
ncbi:hypothetical protein ACQ33O_05150 [Ferruginibacter sp. SUN002]|uniref:hypothetical protein n=1 Tax=Ferruginibacter sp. SUN002 TaxID=2937789 RepID=UPI003D3686FD